MQFDTESFVQLTEAQLLKDIGENLKTYFSPLTTQYQKVVGERNGRMIEETDDLYEKVQIDNPKSAILPMAQVNMVANVSFHLLAQQLAMFFSTRPAVDKDTVFKTTFDNIQRLTAYYAKLLKEEGQDEGNGEGSSSGSTS